MTQINTLAPATGDTIGSPETEILYLDPDTAALFAEVDAILCAALAPVRRPPAPPATGRALVEARSAALSGDGLVRPRRGPARPVRAVERGPPTPQQPATKVNNPVKGR
jgi:hypothetical protein